jgi:AraC-like DNA-binding protein
MKIHIKNMVCDRCRFAIQGVLDELDVEYESVSLGEADLGERDLDDATLDRFREKVEALGFELINDRKSRLIESIKTQIVTLLQQPDVTEKFRLSDYLAQRLFHDYTYLSNLFSSVEGVTIEQYFIGQRIEKVKELLVYDELTLTEIAYRLGFSSVSHLSRQFKKITGQTPSEFKSLRDSRQRRPLDKA